MQHFLDVFEEDFETANDLMRSRTDIVPFDSYPHPEDSDYHRMEFENEEKRNAILSMLKGSGVECYRMDGEHTSTGLFIYND